MYSLVLVYDVVPVGALPAAVSRLDRWVVPQRFLRWTDSAPERIWLGVPLAPRILFTCSPDDARIVFTERDGRLRFGEGLRRFAPHEALFGADALDALDGPDHPRFRRQLTAAFHGDALRGYAAGIAATAARHVERWPTSQPVRFAELSRTLARDVIAETVLGVRDPERGRRLSAALDRLDRVAESPELTARMAAAILLRGRWAPFPRVASILAELEAISREEIAARRHAGVSGGADSLARFLALEGEDAVSDDEIVTAMRVLVVAGWATSANTLGWMIERLAHTPEALARCHEDVDRGESRYLAATVQETLRMRPPVPVTVRYAAADVELPGLTVRRGTVVCIDIERMHHRPDVYPEPRRFRPDRFLRTRPGTYTWIPFGGGVHRCIGAGFALTELRLILEAMLSRVTLAPATGRDEAGRRTPLITAPAQGAEVTLLPVA
jgi:cytochrome P450